MTEEELKIIDLRNGQLKNALENLRFGYLNKINELEKEIKRLQKLLSQEEYRIGSLLERVGEANKIIKYYAEKHGKLKACDYLNKWGVK